MGQIWRTTEVAEGKITHFFCLKDKDQFTSNFLYSEFAVSTMADSQGSVPVLVQKLCDNILAHASLQTGWNNGYTSTFQAPHHHALGWNRKRQLVLRHLTDTVFDLILLRKWEWFGVWGSEITPECRCLSHTYDMHLWGMHREAVRLEEAVGTLMEKGDLEQHLKYQCTDAQFIIHKLFTA